MGAGDERRGTEAGERHGPDAHGRDRSGRLDRGGAPGEDPEQAPVAADTSETNQSLLLLAASPTIWSIHFLACYITAAIWCAKVAGLAGPLGAARLAVGVYTLLALAGIAFVGMVGYRRHDVGSATVPHDFDTPADRHRFLGFATLLLSGLSAVAVVYTALAAVFVATCG